MGMSRDGCWPADSCPVRYALWVPFQRLSDPQKGKELEQATQEVDGGSEAETQAYVSETF